MKTCDIELAVSAWIGTRNHLIVPNVSWGLYLHECDLLVVSKSGYATEIEIKVTPSDLRADSKKIHEHRSKRIKFLYFAMPKEMRGHVNDVPERAGVILVDDKEYCELVRRPVSNPLAVKITPDDQFQIARLGTLRMWNLKRELRDIRKHTIADAVAVLP